MQNGTFKQSIQLLVYKFSLVLTNENRVIFCYIDTTQPAGNVYEIKNERLCAVTSYKPAFNAEYALEDLPDELFDALHGLYYEQLMNWLIDAYTQLIIRIAYGKED